jgi:hypothetical protein
VTTRFALVASAVALIAGVATLTYLLSDAGRLTLCDLWPPPRCFASNLSGVQYFTGDSQAAPVWNLALDVVGPLLAIGAAILHLRGRFASALVLAALACVPYATFVLGTYAVMPFHPIVAGAVLVTLLAVSLGTIQAVWPPPHRASSV